MFIQITDYKLKFDSFLGKWDEISHEDKIININYIHAISYHSESDTYVLHVVQPCNVLDYCVKKEDILRINQSFGILFK